MLFHCSCLLLIFVTISTNTLIVTSLIMIAKELQRQKISYTVVIVLEVTSTAQEYVIRFGKSTITIVNIVVKSRQALLFSSLFYSLCCWYSSYFQIFLDLQNVERKDEYSALVVAVGFLVRFWINKLAASFLDHNKCYHYK